MAQDNIEINSIEFEKGLDQEYEAVDESIRSKVDELQQQTQDTLVQLVQVRKQALQKLSKIQSETISIVSDMTCEAKVEIEKTCPVVLNEQLIPTDVSNIVTQATDLKNVFLNN
jgi:hypothetical protein